MCKFCTILNKELEHLWVLVSVGHPGTDLQQILTDELCVCMCVCVCTHMYARLSTCLGILSFLEFLNYKEITCNRLNDGHPKRLGSNPQSQ